ncbi:MAG: PAS domain S-box protein, partial [Kiloniellales bacterium]|nr:PAS domain S-box protein [Kiloniellales bacterium]
MLVHEKAAGPRKGATPTTRPMGDKVGFAMSKTPHNRRRGRKKTTSKPGLSPRAEGDFLRQILDINPNLIFAKDREGRFTLVNQTVADIYGTTLDDLIGKTDADFNPNADEVAFFRQMDLQVMDTLEEKVIPEELITDAQGNTHWLQTVKRPIIGPDGKANQVLGVATDITQRKNLEEQLRHAQKMEALGQLAGGIAHDFNNMLVVILGNAQRLLQRAQRGAVNQDELASGLEMVVSAAERTAVLIRRLLAFGRKQAVHPVILDPNRIVTELSELLQQLIGEHNRLLVRTGSSWTVRADAGEMEQIIVNLVLNARDAMPEGGAVEVTTSDVTVDASMIKQHPEAVQGDYIKISVKDEG